MKEIYLVSGTEVKQFDNESEILINALKKRGIEAQLACWDDPQVDWGKPGLVVVKSASDYAWKRHQFLDWTRKASEKNRLWNPPDVLEWNSDKNYLIEMQEAEVPMPPTILIRKGSTPNLEETLKGRNWGEFVVKPTTSVGSLGLRRFKLGDPEAERHCRKITHEGFTDSVLGKSFTFPPCDALVQPFVSEIFSVGEASLIFFGGRLSHSVIKRVKQGDFRAHPGFGATVTPYDASRSVVKCAVDALRLSPSVPEYARVDVIPGVDGPLLLEAELIDPWLFFPLIEGSVERYADHISNSI
jgi:glutathione synthase/RimK-type ligase-like ATP-grasp enzyme